MTFKKLLGARPEEAIAARRPKAELLEETTVIPQTGRRELQAEEACGEIKAEISPQKSNPGIYQRIKLAVFVLRKFHDMGMALASLDPRVHYGGYLQKKHCAFINRCNIYDFYRAAERYLSDFKKNGNPAELRCFCEYFVKIEKFEKLHAGKNMTDKDEERLSGDQGKYLKILHRGLDGLVEMGYIDRPELEAMLDRSGRYLD